MKCTPSLTLTIFLTLITGLTYGQNKLIVSASDIEIKFVDKNCWVDFFENSEFDVNDPHVRVLGPIQSATLADVGGQNWNDEIQSLIVGSNATVHVYKDREFSGTELVFMSNQRISGELDELDMSHNIESL